MKDFSIQLSSLTLSLALILVCPIQLTAQDPELVVEIESKQVYEGESFTYRVTLNHIDSPSPPDLRDFEDFAVEAIGEVDLNSQQIIVVNGVRQDIVQRGRQYQYRLTPRKSGDLTVPAPRAEVAGKILVGKALPIKVIAADSQDFVKLRASVDRDKVFPTQPFTVSLQVTVKALPEPASDTDPLSVQSEPPLLTIDWLDDERLDKSVKPESPWQEELQKLISPRGTGFRINSIRSSSAFSFFDRSLAFHPPAKIVRQQDKDGNESDYWIYEFKRTLRAQNPGVYQFSAASLKGTFATKFIRKELKGEAIFAKSDSLTVEVRDVPEQGRPESYIGAIGKFTLVGELSPTEARVGDPLTLTLSLIGAGAADNARPPDLAKVDQLVKGFKVYEGTTQTKGDTRKFTYGLRPLDASVSELPSIPVSYFDAEEERFVTLTTQPIALKLSAAQQLTTNDVVASTTNANDETGIEVAKGGLLANYSLQSLRDDSVDPKRWFFGWAGLVVGIALLNFISSMIKRRQADPAEARRRSALSRAQTLIDQAKSTSAPEHQLDSIDTIRRAITGLVGDLLGLESQGVTASEVQELLRRRSVDSSLQESVSRLLEQCDAAKFGSTAVSISELISQASTLAPQLHQQITRKKNARVQHLILAIVTLHSCVTFGCSTPVNEQVSRQFLEAEQSFEKANSIEDFQNVALRYQQMIDDGFRSGAVFYNQGNAWARANQVGRAIAAYRQALRYSPRDKNALANLEITMAGIPELQATAKPSGIFSYIYFWRNGFSLRELFVIETILILALAVAGTCFWQRGRCRSLAVALLVPTAAMGASCFFEWHEQLVKVHGVVIDGPLTALKGDGENYQPAFTGQIPAGTEFRVNEHRREWLEVEFEGIGSGWVPESKTVLY